MPVADLLFTGGTVFTASPTGAPPSTVAVTEGRIVAVGDARVRELIGPHTSVIDLDGGLLVPGFQDAHVHPVQGGLERLSCDLSDLDTEAGYLHRLGKYAARRPDLDWLTGGGWMLAAFPGGLPRREALDAISPDRPVMLINRDHHGAWVNSLALRLAGLSAATPDPVDGRIERDADGSPTGMLHEGAMELVGTVVPKPTVAEQVAGLLEAQAYLHSMGITAWQDAILGTYANIVDASEAYAGCVADGSLTAKVVGALWWDRTRGADQIPELVERRDTWSREGFRPTSIKVMQDGIVENYTAAMLGPYLDGAGGRTTNSGLSMVDPTALCDYVSELDALGFQVHVHAIGDRAVREALNAFEAAREANGVTDNRHHIAHLQMIHPTDIARFAQLGVTANLQALWATNEEQMTDLTLPFVDAERIESQYRFADLHRAGARLAAGSDWPVSSPNPLWAIHVAVTRQLPVAAGVVEAPFMPEQSIDVHTALTAYTKGSAFVNHLDDSGVVREGACADFAVLDRDILTSPVDEIGSASVLATYVDGVEVYSR